jgi:DNA-binding transcriptional LysR family regulator
MELRQLKYFIGIAEELHFGRAAEKLNVTPSALSQQIQLLESELGVDLFDQQKRTTFRRVELTEAGHIFWEEARKTVQFSEKAIEKARNAHLKKRSIKLGIFRNILPERVEKIVQLWTKPYPNLEIKIVEFASVIAVQEALQKDIIDLGLTLMPLNFDGLDCVIYDETYLGILMPKSHALAGKAVIKLSDLKNEKWIDYGKGVNAHNKTIEKACQKSGFSRESNVSQVVPSVELLKRWVNLEKGIAFMPLTLDIEKEPNLMLKQIVNPDETPFEDIKIRNVAAFKKDNETDLLKLLVELMEKTYQTL